MAEACLDSNSNPSTPKLSHRTFPPGLNGGMGVMSNVNAPDYLALALRRMNSTDSNSSVGTSSASANNSLPLSPLGNCMRNFGLGPGLGGGGPVYSQENLSNLSGVSVGGSVERDGSSGAGGACVLMALPSVSETWTLG